jgi:hypothetical protein
MVHDGRHKLIWYPAGNIFQLFDLEKDPREQVDCIDVAEYVAIQKTLKEIMISQLHGVDLAWEKDGQLIGFAPLQQIFKPDRAMSGQRGLHFPAPPLDPLGTQVGSP